MKQSFDFIYDYPNKKVVLIHGDADGLSSGAELIREFERRGIEDYEVVITQPFSLQNDLAKYNDKCNVIIIDLAINDRAKELLLPGVVVIDHHPETITHKNDLEERGVFVLVSDEMSASQLVATLVKNDKVTRYLSRLGAVGDWVIDDAELGKQTTVLAASMGINPDDDWMRYYILANLAEGKTVWEMKEVKSRSSKAFKRLDIIRENYFNVFEDERFIVRFYPEGFGFAKILANKLYKESDKIAFVACYLDPLSSEILVTGRTKTAEKFDLREIFFKFNTAWHGYGGGHQRAASGVLPKENLIDFCVYLKNLDLGDNK
jgi:oligoribonuclease NrnB/cAMP/cGMP phosphodiesterase (DHH superfamily)